MHKRLVAFLDSNDVFFKGQFGFRSNHSTTHAILLTVDKIQTAIEKTVIFLWLVFGFE